VSIAPPYNVQILTEQANIPGSLIFGGFDSSRLDPNTMLSFPMNRHNHTHSVTITSVSIQGDKLSNARSANHGPFSVDMDFGRPYIRLPHAQARDISGSLGLNYDKNSERYTVSEDRHNELSASKTKLVFTLQGERGQQEYTIPYGYLIFETSEPINGTTKVFAMKGSAAKYSLGRAFFQEAHMIAVFDHMSGGYFNISQAKYEHGKARKIIEIQQGGLVVDSHKGRSPGAIAGIVVGVVAAAGVLAYLLFACLKGRPPFRKRRERPESTIQLQTNPQFDGIRRSRDIESTKESVYYEAQENPTAKGDEPPQYAASPLDAKK
jgi:hypothetical protein